MLQRCATCGTLRLPTLACPMCAVAPPLIAVALTGCPSITSDGFLPAYGVMETGVFDTGGDVDADGYTVSEGDCDDHDADVHPGATETVGDHLDANCDGEDDT